MSRPPPSGQTYAFTAGVPAMASNYYYDDTEEYIGDYSENDALSDGPPCLLPTPNVTEIYRRKPNMSSTLEHYRHQYAPNNFHYYDIAPVPQQQQMRRPSVPTTYRRHMPIVDERTHYYTAATLDNGYRNAVVYSNPQIPSASTRRSPTYPPTTTVTRHVIRRHPVTVRTPRYYRRTTAAMAKKPSTLCLPVACQPDPAVYRRVRRNSEDPIYTPQRHGFGEQSSPAAIVERPHSIPLDCNHDIETDKLPTDYSDELHMTQSDVDAVLARYENILGDASITKVPSAASSKSSKSSNTKSNNLKPKIPASIRQKQECFQESTQTNNQSQKAKLNGACNIKHLESEEITTEVLDSMLSELLNNGCENKINQKPKTSSQMTPRKSDYSVKRPSSSTPKDDNISEFPKSFTYQDITENMSKSQQNIYSLNNNQISSPVGNPNVESHGVCAGSNVAQNHQLHTRRGVDAACALELHRSKSYIVSLIDRALSKELGTIPEQEPLTNHSHLPVPLAQKEGEQMNARQAIDFMNKNCDKMDKGLCLEIKQALTDSILPNATTPQGETKHNSTCSCNVQDEPLYVKQLKQLRWGHLKHIQREVRRLEDLERFLDSCSSGESCS